MAPLDPLLLGNLFLQEKKSLAPFMAYRGHLVTFSSFMIKTSIAMVSPMDIKSLFLMTSGYDVISSYFNQLVVLVTTISICTHCIH